MKNLAFIAIIFLLFSCGQSQSVPPLREIPVTELPVGISGQLTVTIFTIDSCEYIGFLDRNGYSHGQYLAHKGNCKFCAARLQNAKPALK